MSEPAQPWLWWSTSRLRDGRFCAPYSGAPAVRFQTADSGEEGRACFVPRRFQIVIMDIRSPVEIQLDGALCFGASPRRAMVFEKVAT